jgi:hypothetical protein
MVWGQQVSFHQDAGYEIRPALDQTAELADLKL